MGINYRQAIGELLYAMVTCRPDISFPVTKLSQYSMNPAEPHYKAVKQLFLYLRSTADDGIYYWRKDPYNVLPMGNEPTPKPEHFEVNFHPTPDNRRLEGGVDATWGNDSSHRKSVSGYALMLSGGCVLYKTRYQPTIALSSTESEFTAACEAGKSILYVRSILDQINLPQPDATVLYVDNNGALLMANAQQPTRRTRHLDLKNFAILDWVERDLLVVSRINTTDNFLLILEKSTRPPCQVLLFFFLSS